MCYRTSLGGRRGHCYKRGIMHNGIDGDDPRERT
jgi:hypothetical protein